MGDGDQGLRAALKRPNLHVASRDWVEGAEGFVQQHGGPRQARYADFVADLPIISGKPRGEPDRDPGSPWL